MKWFAKSQANKYFAQRGELMMKIHAGKAFITMLSLVKYEHRYYPDEIFTICFCRVSRRINSSRRGYDLKKVLHIEINFFC